MKEFTINSNDDGKRLDNFISKVCPTMPKNLLYKLIRKKDIKVNGKKCEISTRVHTGDLVRIYADDSFFVAKQWEYDFLKASPAIDIVYEDENIILVNKPQGLLVHPDSNEYIKTLINSIQHYLYKKGEYNPKEENTFVPSLCNRIDRNTGGIVIAAKNNESLKVMCQKIKDREIDKFYLTKVHGIPKVKSATLTGYLEKNEDKNMVFISKNPKSAKSQKILTKYETIKIDKNENSSILEVELLTGRTHQIRAHLASNNLPIYGDGKYSKIGNNDRKKGYRYQALYSYKLHFNFTTDAGCLEYLNDKTFQIDTSAIKWL